MRRAIRRPVGQAHVCPDKIETPRSRARRTVKLLCYVNFALSWRAAMRRHCDTSSRFLAIGGTPIYFRRGMPSDVSWRHTRCFLLSVTFGKKEKVVRRHFLRLAVYDCVMNSDQDRNGHVKNNCGIDFIHMYVAENAKNCLLIHIYN